VTVARDQTLDALTQLQGGVGVLEHAKADLQSRFERHEAASQRRLDRYRTELDTSRSRITQLEGQLSTASSRLQHANRARDRAIADQQATRRYSAIAS
jgi:chromosome segregation ATPase